MSKRFTLETALPVKAPYRLDLTADALRRLAANVVDRVGEDGVYRRVLADAHGRNLIEVSQTSGRALQLRMNGRQPERWLPVIERMLGTHVSLAEWHKRVKPFPWLAFLADELRGVRPPRYPSLWEALAHAIVFQQISIHAAGAIMRRMVMEVSEPMHADDDALYPFPLPKQLLEASDAQLRAAGLSANKVAHLRSAAQSVLHGEVRQDEIETTPTLEAIEMLTRVRGIGPWSAAVVMLRGFGRLDIFPLKDSGVARSIRLLSGDPNLDVTHLLAELGPVRGMLYFHLLLGRIHNISMSGNTQ